MDNAGPAHREIGVQGSSPHAERVASPRALVAMGLQSARWGFSIRVAVLGIAFAATAVAVLPSELLQQLGPGCGL